MEPNKNPIVTTEVRSNTSVGDRFDIRDRLESKDNDKNLFAEMKEITANATPLI